MDLGTKRPEGGALISPAKGEKNKVSYPSFNISDEKAKKFLAEYDCDVDDELTATVKLRVSGLRKDEYGHSLTLDVQSIDDVKDESEKEEPDEEEKVLGYKRKKSESMNETPDTSAKNLEE